MVSRTLSIEGKRRLNRVLISSIYYFVLFYPRRKVPKRQLVKEIVERYGVTEQHAYYIINRLRELGLIKVKKGKKGDMVIRDPIIKYRIRITKEGHARLLLK